MSQSDNPKTAAAKVCDEIQSIMGEYRRQVESGFVDTPGGLEHMGDVWKMMDRWDRMLGDAA